MEVFDFLHNAVAGAAINLGVSGMVGQLMGVGATLALNPALMLMGVVVGGSAIALLKMVQKRPQIYLIVDNS